MRDFLTSIITFHWKSPDQPDPLFFSSSSILTSSLTTILLPPLLNRIVISNFNYADRILLLLVEMMRLGKGMDGRLAGGIISSGSARISVTLAICRLFAFLFDIIRWDERLACWRRLVGCACSAFAVARSVDQRQAGVCLAAVVSESATKNILLHIECQSIPRYRKR